MPLSIPNLCVLGGAIMVGLAGIHLLRAAPTPPETTPTEIPGTEMHVYRNGKPNPMRLFVVKPKEWKADDQRPALIYFFGGGWSKGTPLNSVSMAKWAASMGMVGIAPDYRTKNRFDTSPLESVADGRAAMHWVQKHAAELGVDPKKIAVGGNSAGGHVATWTTITKTPPGSDPAEAPIFPAAALILSSAVTDTSMLSGYTPKRFGTNAEALSPTHQMDQKMPSTLMFHGDADELVNYSTAVTFRDKMAANGNTCELITVPDGSHGFTSDKPEWKLKVREKITEFLTEQKLITKEE